MRMTYMLTVDEARGIIARALVDRYGVTANPDDVVFMVANVGQRDSHPACVGVEVGVEMVPKASTP